MHVRRFIFLLLLLMLIGNGILAAQDTPTPTQSADEASDIELKSFTLPFGDDDMLNGLVPSEWDEVQAGTAIRVEEEGANVTYLVHIATPETSLVDALEPLLEPLQVATLPEASDEYNGLIFTWMLYEISYQPAEDVILSVWLATAEDDLGAYIIILQSLPDEAEALYESVLIPALDTFGAPLDAVSDYLDLEDFTRTTLPEFGIEANIPAQWAQVNTGAYMRGADETDFTTLLIQTSPDLSEGEFADLLRETIGIPVALGDGEIVTLDDAEWTVYQVEFDAQGFETTLLIATTNAGEKTVMVALLSTAEEADNLREQILLPIMESIE